MRSSGLLLRSLFEAMGVLPLLRLMQEVSLQSCTAFVAADLTVLSIVWRVAVHTRISCGCGHALLGSGRAGALAGGVEGHRCLLNLELSNNFIQAGSRF